jgi:hypothetical protein
VRKNEHSMRKTAVIWIVILFTSACKNNEYLLIESVKGKIVSSSDKKPVGEAKIYVDKSAFNAFDTINTQNDGHFFVDKVSVSDFKDMHRQRDVSYKFVIEKKGFKKMVIDVRNYKKNETPSLNDTIDLGIIYLDKLKAHKNTSVHNDWSGIYNGSFLRMKGEYADPRGWGQIKIEVGKGDAKFQLDSYIENLKRELKIVHVDAKEIHFAALDDKTQKLIMLLDQGKYRLSGNLMEQIVGVKETYELKKSK